MPPLRPCTRPTVSRARRDRAIREALSFEDYSRPAARRPTRGGDLTGVERSVLDELPGPLDVLAIVGEERPVPRSLLRLVRLAARSSRLRLHIVVADSANRDIDIAYRPDGGPEPAYLVLDAGGAELGLLGRGDSPVVADLADIVLRG
jgi:hypothetical protein